MVPEHFLPRLRSDRYYSVEDHFGDLGTVPGAVRKAHPLGLKVIQIRWRIMLFRIIRG